MTLLIQIDGPSGSMNLNQNSDSATQITTEMKMRSNQLVSIGRNCALRAKVQTPERPGRCPLAARLK